LSARREIKGKMKESDGKRAKIDKNIFIFNGNRELLSLAKKAL
jgi:hypothetical protein